MNNAVDHPDKPLTLDSIYRELLALRERVEDLEDLLDLEHAVKQNAEQHLIPWEQAKTDLDLE